MNYYEASVGKKEHVGLKMMKRLGFVKGYGLGRKDDEGNCVGRLYPVHFKHICIGECREDGEVYQLHRPSNALERMFEPYHNCAPLGVGVGLATSKKAS